MNKLSPLIRAVSKILNSGSSPGWEPCLRVRVLFHHSLHELKPPVRAGKGRKVHIQLLTVSELLLLLFTSGIAQVPSCRFCRDLLQSQNTATPNSCHSLLQEPTYAALTAPASSGNCRDPGSPGWGLNPITAWQLSGTTTTAQICWQHTFPKNHQHKFWQALSNQQAFLWVFFF